MNLDRYAKCIVGALIAGLGALQVALISAGVSATEWIVVALAFITALGVVWATPNTPSDEDIDRLVTLHKAKRGKD